MQDKEKSPDQRAGNPLDDVSRGSQKLCYSLSTASEKGKDIFHGSGEGSGIGLSLVQELIKLHGRTVEVTSVVDQGTSFIVSIPTGYAHLPSDRIGATRTLASTAVGGATYVEEALRWLPEVGGERAETKASDLSLPVPVQTLQHTPTARILVADNNADMREYVQCLLLRSLAKIT